MNRTEYYQRLAKRHGSQKTIALLCDIIAELSQQLRARQKNDRRRLEQLQEAPR